MSILLLILTLFAALRFLVTLINLITRQWLRPNQVAGHPSVSVLIPARNEEANISRILSDLVESAGISLDNQSGSANSDGAPVIREILVYDDQSTDQTVARIETVVAPPGLIRVIRGSELPAGWLGKNHACHRLAQEAKGDWLLFLDADVRVAPDLIRDAIGFAQVKRLALLSIFPRQILKTAGEWLVVPLMNWILVSLLPLILVRTCRWTSFSAANGQFMLFHGDAYRRFQWHRQVKADPVEDIRISGLIKKNRLRTTTLLSAGQVSCRMYESNQQAVTGFSKNIGQFFGNSMLWMVLFVLLTTILPVVAVAGLLFLGPDLPASLMRLLPFAGNSFFVSILLPLYAVLVLAIRVLTSLLSRQNILLNLLWWLPQQAMLMLLAWRSIRYRTGRPVSWKGRQI
jgi:glycosyltransferase involved in cell wall biosynthesis